MVVLRIIESPFSTNFHPVGRQMLVEFKFVNGEGVVLTDDVAGVCVFVMLSKE